MPRRQNGSLDYLVMHGLLDIQPRVEVVLIGITRLVITFLMLINAIHFEFFGV